MPTCPKATTSAPENPEESGNLDCIDEDDNGSDYAGKVTVTVTGATCNKWSDADLGNWAYGSMGEYLRSFQKISVGILTIPNFLGALWLVRRTLTTKVLKAELFAMCLPVLQIPLLQRAGSF